MPVSSVATRCGPSRPRCSHTLLEPGPPLKLKVSGRGTAASSVLQRVGDEEERCARFVDTAFVGRGSWCLRIGVVVQAQQHGAAGGGVLQGCAIEHQPVFGADELFAGFGCCGRRGWVCPKGRACALVIVDASHDSNADGAPCLLETFPCLRALTSPVRRGAPSPSPWRWAAAAAGVVAGPHRGLARLRGVRVVAAQPRAVVGGVRLPVRPAARTGAGPGLAAAVAGADSPLRRAAARPGARHVRRLSARRVRRARSSRIGPATARRVRRRR